VAHSKKLQGNGAVTILGTSAETGESSVYIKTLATMEQMWRLQGDCCRP